jgi:hypothetical protein
MEIEIVDYLSEFTEWERLAEYSSINTDEAIEKALPCSTGLETTP